MPTALASMTSKYLRELSMRAFNDYWCGRVQNLAPTAGYPRDARRFMNDIQTVQAKLGIAKALMSARPLTNLAALAAGIVAQPKERG